MAMQPFRKHTGLAAPLYRANIDTDQIIPKQFLKRIERTGFGQFLFYDWRFDATGAATPDFVLNKPERKGASILIGGVNFGCGSSREHAPWALADFGFRAVVAPSYADIFHNNALKNGILTVELPESDCAELARRAEADASYQLTIDLEAKTISDTQGFKASFEIDDFARRCLLDGLDDIGLTLEHAAEIAAYENALPDWCNRKK